LKFLKRLLGKPEPIRIMTDRLQGPGTFEIQVTDVSVKNLDVYWKATSNQWRRNEDDRDFYEMQTDAAIVSDVENRVPHAMLVEIAGKAAGHLGHTDALKLHRRLNDLGYGQIRASCLATIIGRTGHWEINLDLDPGLSGARAATSDAGG
jgi:hypothetical protein